MNAADSIRERKKPADFGQKRRERERNDGGNGDSRAVRVSIDCSIIAYLSQGTFYNYFFIIILFSFGFLLKFWWRLGTKQLER